MLSVVTVFGFYLSAMHEGDRAAEVQTDACSLHAQVFGVMPLIESFEETVGIFALEAYAIVDDLNLCFIFSFVQHNFHFTSIEGVFEGIRE